MEAKKNDIDAGLGQCAAQMIGAWRFHERSHHAIAAIFGCVTTGEDWQSLKLEHQTITIDRRRYYSGEVETILGVFLTMLAPYI